MSQVQGTVVRVDQRGAYVDIGGKSTAFCPTAELALANIPKARTCCFACLLLLLLLLCAASVACCFSWWFQPVRSHAHVLAAAPGGGPPPKCRHAASVAANCCRTGGLCQLSSPSISGLYGWQLRHSGGAGHAAAQQPGRRVVCRCAHAAAGLPHPSCRSPPLWWAPTPAATLSSSARSAAAT